MDVWSSFIGFISNTIMFLSAEVGLSQAVAIMLFTLLARLILSPINTKATINMFINKRKIIKLKPELEKIKLIYQDNPKEKAKRTMALYKKHQITLLDKTSIVNMTSQGILGFGIFQSLQQMVFNSKFAWIANIAKPDIALAFLVGALTYLSMIAMPGSAEQTSTLLFIIPAVISILVLVSFPSAIGLYWATSNGVSLMQSLWIRLYLKKESTIVVG